MPKTQKSHIKRAKHVKKKITAKEKALAGLGVGATLLGGLGAVSPKSQTTEFVRTKTDEKATEGNKAKGALKKIFGAKEAKAFEDPAPVPSDYEQFLANLYGSFTPAGYSEPIQRDPDYTPPVAPNPAAPWDYPGSIYQGMTQAQHDAALYGTVVSPGISATGNVNGAVGADGTVYPAGTAVPSGTVLAASTVGPNGTPVANSQGSWQSDPVTALPMWVPGPSDNTLPQRIQELSQFSLTLGISLPQRASFSSDAAFNTARQQYTTQMELLNKFVSGTASATDINNLYAALGELRAQGYVIQDPLILIVNGTPMLYFQNMAGWSFPADQLTSNAGLFITTYQVNRLSHGLQVQGTISPWVPPQLLIEAGIPATQVQGGELSPGQLAALHQNAGPAALAS